MADRTPMHTDLATLSEFDFTDSPRKLFSMRFYIRNSPAGARGIKHSEACSNVALGLIGKFCMEATQISVEDGIKVVQVSFTKDIFVVSAPAPLAEWAVNAGINFNAVCGSHKATYTLQARAYAGPATLTERETETVMKATVLVPFNSVDPESEIETRATNKLAAMGLKLIRYNIGRDHLKAPINKRYITFEMMDGAAHFPFEKLHLNKSFTTITENTYMIKWNEGLCTNYEVCPGCYKSTNLSAAVRCTCVSSGRKRARTTSGSSTSEAIAAAANSIF